MNFAAHASHFKDIDVTLLGVVGKDKYAEAIMDSISKLDIDKSHIRIDERYQTAKNTKPRNEQRLHRTLIRF